MRFLLWTDLAQGDLAAIHAFISRDSPDYAAVVVAKLIAAAERLRDFPESGRAVPELANLSVREVIHPPHRIVYRLVSEQAVHILTVHHSARRFPIAV